LTSKTLTFYAHFARSVDIRLSRWPQTGFWEANVVPSGSSVSRKLSDALCRLMHPNNSGCRESMRTVHPFMDDFLSTVRASRLKCGQYAVNDLPTFECSALCAALKIQ
jgi:hypothetical protein